MQTTEDKWYIGYRWASLVFASLVFVACVLCLTLPAAMPFGQKYGLNYIAGAIALIEVLFGAFYYERHAKKVSHWQSMILMSMIQTTLVFSIIQTSGKILSPAMAIWGVILFMSGMYGVFALGGTAFLTAIYFIMNISDEQGHVAFDQTKVIIAVVFLFIPILSRFFWRRHYIDSESVKVASLTGQLKTNQKQSELLVQSLTDGVLLLDTEGRISLMNPAAATMTGWTVDEGTGTDFKLVLKLRKEDNSDLVETENPINRIFVTKVAATETLQLTSRAGKQTVVSVVVSPILDAKAQTLTGAVAVIRDISVAHQEEKQRAEFISTASHEMRTPVAAIEGYLALAMNEKVSKIDSKARSYLEKAHESTQHLGKLFQDLLMSAKAEDGRLTSHPSVVEMGAYVEQLAESFRFAAEKKGLLTDFVFGASGAGSKAGEHIIRPLYYVYVDPDRIREVVTNLFDNAVKYTPSGKVSLGLTGNNDVVQIYVKDTGPGIPPEDVPHLFQKFYRVDNSATRTIGGTGLGLFICRKIVELYKGRIWAESKVGEGSIFYVNLPRLTSQKANELQGQDALHQQSEPVSSLTTPV